MAFVRDSLRYHSLEIWYICRKGEKCLWTSKSIRRQDRNNWDETDRLPLPDCWWRDPSELCRAINNGFKIEAWVLFKEFQSNDVQWFALMHWELPIWNIQKYIAQNSFIFYSIARFVSVEFLKFIEKHGVVRHHVDEHSWRGANGIMGEKQTRLTASVCNEHLWAAYTDAWMCFTWTKQVVKWGNVLEY